jgi:hypothetical protein
VLADRVAEIKVLHDDCDANHVRLTRNVRSMICLGDATGSAPVPEQLAAGDASPAGEASPDAAGLKKPEVPSTHEGLMKRAPVLLELSKKAFFDGEKLILFQRAICDKANEKVMASFRKRNSENKDMKESLEAQMREMDGATLMAEKSIDRMKRDIEFFGKVELQPKVDSTEALVAKLRAAKQELVDDLLRKTVSMRIDDCCRKVTAERTMQPPESMPVASLLDPKPKPKLIKRQQSSPAFVNGNIESAASTCIDSMASTATTMAVRPPSPAGNSSPLKAAAAAAMAK